MYYGSRTEKTAREWFDTLPDGYRELAFVNEAAHGRKQNKKYISLAGALMDDFTWDVTPQGYEFWGAVYDFQWGRVDSLPELNSN